jgi:hypothetical protein
LGGRAHDGDVLEKYTEDIWTTTRSQRFFGLETGTRMNVVRLASGGLVVHCPVALDPSTRAEVDALGPVVAVVASSLFHHLYVGEWMKAYPDAAFCACPRLDRKRADLRWSHVLGDEPHQLWEGQLDQVYFGARFEHEVVFFHRKSRTLLCADALLNLSKHPSRVTRAAAFLMANNAPGKGWMEYIALRDRKAGREQLERMLAWDIDRILLAHGGLVESNGREVLREAYKWV